MYNKSEITIDLSLTNTSEKLIALLTKEIFENCPSIIYYDKIILNNVLKFYSEYGGFIQLLYYVQDNFKVKFLNKSLILDKHIEELECISFDHIEQWSEFARVHNLVFPYKPNIIFDNEDLKMSFKQKTLHTVRNLCWKLKSFIT